jgi:hypothetical protein
MMACFTHWALHVSDLDAAIAFSADLTDGGVTIQNSVRQPADKRQRGIPGPHGNGKIERGDDSHRTEWMPGFHHPVVQALACDRQTVELPGKADSKV